MKLGRLFVVGCALACLAAAPARAEWRVAGQVGGSISAIATNSTNLYAGVGQRLHVYDVVDPAAGHETGSTNALGDFISDIVVVASTAYVTAGKTGLHIVDISDSANPRSIGRWDSPGSAESVAVAGTRAYVADGPFGVHIIDISRPTAPQLLSTVFDDSFAFDVAVFGTHIFIAAAGAGLLVADVGDSIHPRAVTGLDTPGFARSLTIALTRLYVADQWGGVRIVDITNPSRPTEVGSIPLRSWAFDVAVSGTTLHVAAGSHGFMSFDVADAARPRRLVAYDMPWNLTWKVSVTEGRAFVSVRSRGVVVLDVRDASAAVQLGVVAPLTNAQAVTANGTVAFAGTESQGVRVLDVADTVRPRERGRANTNVYVHAVAANDRHLYSCEGTVPDHFLRSYDVSNPDRPSPLASVKISQGHCRDLFLADNWLYLPDEFGIQIWDVSNPAAPVASAVLNIPESGSVDATSGTEGIEVVGSTIFVDTQRGISVVDASDRRNPKLSSSFTPAESAVQFFDLATDGEFVYATTGIPFPTLYVLQIKEAGRLVFVGKAALPAPGMRVVVRNQRAFVAVGAAGVAVIDVSNPVAPRLSERIAVPAFAKELRFAGNRLLVAASDGGFVVIEETLKATSSPDAAVASAALAIGVGAANLRGRFLRPSLAPIAIEPARHGIVTTGRTVTVASAADDGAGTLREALTNLQAGDTITFDSTVFRPDAPATIRPLTVLPRLTRDDVMIDASDAGVILDGSALSGRFDAGIQINSRRNGVKGLQIVNFPYAGIWITAGGADNLIGGNRSLGRGPFGEGNVISANREVGITVNDPGGNRIVGNFIGTDTSGQRSLGPQQRGVEIFYGLAEGTLTIGDRIGGDEAWEANVIAGNSNTEINLHNARSVEALGNFIGTDPTGSRRVGASQVGINTSLVAGSTIRGNTIAGEQWAVVIIDPGSHSNLIENNWIGVTKSGVALSTRSYDGGVPIFESFNAVVGNVIRTGIQVTNFRGVVAEAVIIGNTLDRGPLPAQPPGQQAAIRIDAGRRTFVGGGTVAERNHIAGSTIGIFIQTPGIDSTFILGNNVRSASTGIDLGFASSSIVQANAITDTDSAITVGAPTNRIRRNSIYMNRVRGIETSGGPIPAPPVITEVTGSHVRGTACIRCTIEIYSDAASQGRRYEGTTTADASGAFLFTTSAFLAGPNVTATATDDAGSTSAFSQSVAAPPAPPRRRAVRH